MDKGKDFDWQMVFTTEDKPDEEGADEGRRPNAAGGGLFDEVPSFEEFTSILREMELSLGEVVDLKYGKSAKDVLATIFRPLSADIDENLLVRRFLEYLRSQQNILNPDEPPRNMERQETETEAYDLETRRESYGARAIRTLNEHLSGLQAAYSSPQKNAAKKSPLGSNTNTVFQKVLSKSYCSPKHSDSPFVFDPATMHRYNSSATDQSETSFNSGQSKTVSDYGRAPPSTEEYGAVGGVDLSQESDIAPDNQITPHPSDENLSSQSSNEDLRIPSSGGYHSGSSNGNGSAGSNSERNVDNYPEGLKYPDYTRGMHCPAYQREQNTNLRPVNPVVPIPADHVPLKSLSPNSTNSPSPGRACLPSNLWRDIALSTEVSRTPSSRSISRASTDQINENADRSLGDGGSIQSSESPFRAGDGLGETYRLQQQFSDSRDSDSTWTPMDLKKATREASSSYFPSQGAKNKRTWAYNDSPERSYSFASENSNRLYSHDQFQAANYDQSQIFDSHEEELFSSLSPHDEADILSTPNQPTFRLRGQEAVRSRSTYGQAGVSSQYTEERSTDVRYLDSLSNQAFVSVENGDFIEQNQDPSSEYDRQCSLSVPPLSQTISFPELPLADPTTFQTDEFSSTLPLPFASRALSSRLPLPLTDHTFSSLPSQEQAFSPPSTIEEQMLPQYTFASLSSQEQSFPPLSTAEEEILPQFPVLQYSQAQQFSSSYDEEFPPLVSPHAKKLPLPSDKKFSPPKHPVLSPHAQEFIPQDQQLHPQESHQQFFQFPEDRIPSQRRSSYGDHSSEMYFQPIVEGGQLFEEGARAPRRSRQSRGRPPRGREPHTNYEEAQAESSWEPMTMYCRYCRSNDHYIKDEKGNITCPTLTVRKCAHCDATGEDSHTIYQCPYKAKNFKPTRDSHYF